MYKWKASRTGHPTNLCVRVGSWPKNPMVTLTDTIALWREDNRRKGQLFLQHSTNQVCMVKGTWLPAWSLPNHTWRTLRPRETTLCSLMKRRLNTLVWMPGIYRSRVTWTPNWGKGSPSNRTTIISTTKTTKEWLWDHSVNCSLVRAEAWTSLNISGEIRLRLRIDCNVYYNNHKGFLPFLEKVLATFGIKPSNIWCV